MDKGCNLPNSPAGSLRDLRTTRSGKQYAAPISGRDHPDMDDMANAEPEPKKTETFNMVATFEIYPEWLRKGPWSPLTSVWLVSFSVALLYSFPMALETGGVPETAAPSTGLTGLRVACGAWGLGFCGYMVAKGWGWAFASYTIWSWVFSSVYFVASAARDLTSGQISSLANWVAAAVRFPALVQVSITVILWWLVLFPMITSLLPAKDKMGFVRFNFGFIMLNIHGAVFPAVLTDFLLSATPLNAFDLWASFAIGLAYIVWYLAFLDRNGFPLYIFLSPRTHWSPLIYSAILALYTACYAGYNSSIGASTHVFGFDTAVLLPPFSLWPLSPPA